MFRTFLYFILLSWIMHSCQKHKGSGTTHVADMKDSLTVKEVKISSQNLVNTIPLEYLHTEFFYTDSTILFQNSYPKGGSYLSPRGKRYGYGIFISSITNKLKKPIEISLSFPDQPLKFNKKIGAQASIFLREHTLNLDQFDLHDYGLGELSFFEQFESNPKEKSISIAPEQSDYICFAILFENFSGGSFRTYLENKNGRLFYTISHEGFEKVSIPCGKILM